MNYLIEICSLNFRAGMQEEFHYFYMEQVLPLLNRWNFDMVALNPLAFKTETGVSQSLLFQVFIAYTFCV
jgi:hypothetical protein